MMQLIRYPVAADYRQITQRPTADYVSLFPVVTPIIEQVRLRGDSALHEFQQHFDGVTVKGLRVTGRETGEAATGVSESLKSAIEQAAANIRRFHQSQLAVDTGIVETMPGVSCWQRCVAIEKVGLYIPGGSAPLFSTLLMLGIPALMAGCREIVVCTPPGKDGRVHPAILYTADFLGLTNIFKAGGAQAIAAMAYGTETIPAVNKIFGPGNRWVTAAKQLVQSRGMAIDMPAGPSELCILADETANAVFIAADLLSQAEHGPDSQVLLISTSERLLNEVMTELNRQLEHLPRRAIAELSLSGSRAVLVNNNDEAMMLANEYAAEHLLICCANAGELAMEVVNAGSVFIGDYSPESAGDYASGTNHTLPTNGAARSYSGLGIMSFMKTISYQRITKQGLTGLSQTIIDMAVAEGLEGHASAVRVRM